MCQTMEQEEPRHAGIKFAKNVLMMEDDDDDNDDDAVCGFDLLAACVCRVVFAAVLVLCA